MTLSRSCGNDPVTRFIVTDVIVQIFATPNPTSEPGSRKWYRVEKDLYLHSSEHHAWLYLALAKEEDLVAGDFLVFDITIGKLKPPDVGLNCPWESRRGGIWIRRARFPNQVDEAVSGVDVLFGVDAVDPRPQWTLMQSPLELEMSPNIPAARLSILRGQEPCRPDVPEPLRVKSDGKFKIVQISDTHMVTGVGICKDAIDEHGDPLPEREADPLTVRFTGKVLDIEKPDLVVLTGDQLHHDISDSQSALFKVVAPIIDRSIPFAAVFGNHDDEGSYALSRAAQMSILRNLPFNLSESGPEQMGGVGNYCLRVLGPAPSPYLLSTLYFLDSHGKARGEFPRTDYEPISQAQIDWFQSTSQAQRDERGKYGRDESSHLSLIFFHIPLPEFGSDQLDIRSGCRREPTESSRTNTHFYDALVKEEISAVGCGHDHVNDFCALLPQSVPSSGAIQSPLGPWLCHGGGSGFGGYGEYNDKRCHRRMRIWELDTSRGILKTWLRVEYATDRVDELVLVDSGLVVYTREGMSTAVT